MAGRRWYVYEDDGGTKYAVQLSKDIQTANQFGFQPLNDNKIPPLPKGMKMRTMGAVLVSGVGTGFRRRTFPVAKRSQPIYVAKSPTKFNYGNLQFETTSKQGESLRFASTVDTGI